MVRLGQPKSKTEFSFFFLPFTRWQRRIRLLYPSKPLGCDPDRVLHGPGGDTDLDVVDGHRYHSSTSGTEYAGGDGPSSAVLDSAGQVSTDSNTVSVVSTEAGTHVVHGCNTVTAERQNVKQSEKKRQQAELIKRQIQEWGLKKPNSAQNKVWDQDFKYDKCPKGTPNGWENHKQVCLGENVGNTVVKLGSSDSPQVLVQHFLQHHKEELETMHKDKQSSIAFTSRDSTGKSTRPSPLRTPTEEQCSLVDEKRKSVNRRARAGPDGLILVDSNPLVWWKKYAETFPFLAQVTRRYLTMSDTSSPVERLFSVTGQVVTVTRNRLHPETVTLLVFITCCHFLIVEVTEVEGYPQGGISLLLVTWNYSYK
jgi:hypothetical protein